MISHQEHLDNLVRHITLVRDACLLLGKRLIARGQIELGRTLIARGFEHDVSKFFGIEWDYLHAGNDVPKDLLAMSIKQHTRTNDHHPEYWGGIEHMPPLAIYEMVCDWYARAQEFGTDLRNWIKQEAVDKYHIDLNGEQYKLIQDSVNLLLVDHFVR